MYQRRRIITFHLFNTNLFLKSISYWSTQCRVVTYSYINILAFCFWWKLFFTSQLPHLELSIKIWMSKYNFHKLRGHKKILHMLLFTGSKLPWVIQMATLSNMVAAILRRQLLYEKVLYTFTVVIVFDHWNCLWCMNRLLPCC